MRRLRWAIVLAAAVAITSTAAATTRTSDQPLPLLTFAVFPTRVHGHTIYRGLCATDLRGHTYRISDLHGNVGPAWSRDGRSIAFTRTDNPGQDRFGLVYVTDAAGRHSLDITHGGARGAFYVVAWSPDGTRLILSWTGWGPYFGSFIEKADGSGGHRLGVEGANPFGGSWSPQGRILFSLSSAYPDRVPAIYVTDADGTYQRKLIDSAAAAVWSPDGRQFAYLAFKNGRSAGLGVAEADGSGAHILVEGSVSLAAWSPDGRQLAYFGSLDDASVPHTLEVVQADGTGAHLLAQGDLSQAAWSPDGSMIAFTRGWRPSRLFLINPDGTGERAVPTGGLPASDPAWRSSASLPDPRPCVVHGTSRADVIRGTDRSDLIYGGAGNDRIDGNGGDDVLVGGLGQDQIHGGRGADKLRAQDGVRDILFGGPGKDRGYLDSVDVATSIEARNY